MGRRLQGTRSAPPDRAGNALQARFARVEHLIQRLLSDIRRRAGVIPLVQRTAQVHSASIHWPH